MLWTSSTLLAALAAPLLASARPVRSRAASAIDATVFQFANVLNQLEAEFYRQGLAKFQDSDFTSAGFASSQMVTQTLSAIQQNEESHIAFIQQALMDNGAQPLTCKFKVDSVLTDVPTMAATARVFEFVGVSAFLGGATLIDDPVLLDAAAAVLTVEARHSTALNILSGGGSSIPSAFDIPLTPQEILGIAGGFIDGPCDLGLEATKPLTITNTGAIAPGTKLTFSGDGIDGTDGLFCNMIIGGANSSVNLPLDNCVVPADINGPVAIWVTKDDKPLVNNAVNRETSAQVAGPTITFVDSKPEMLVQMVRGGASASGPSSASGNGQAAAPAAPASSPLPTDFAGLSPDGSVTVNKVSMVARPAAPSGA